MKNWREEFPAPPTMKSWNNWYNPFPNSFFVRIFESWYMIIYWCTIFLCAFQLNVARFYNGITWINLLSFFKWFFPIFPLLFLILEKWKLVGFFIFFILFKLKHCWKLMISNFFGEKSLGKIRENPQPQNLI